ncbi:ATP-binding cassette domain-containing protein [Staphylococcus sp. SQ8-PEA]|uniref:ATP-binding cassette domain-containing protein n=1 Tax=Staphylococcus marylandisciuri TaxID=2981529 RepID=A0ABT2QN41_9STAP|nr:ATP-binding cassette domain-containing protein [Staphylococcus marylandisciuri]MCU5745397.1 ATP-binding cassette domain-containing protein [Staphylococcus marylandisciuri]
MIQLNDVSYSYKDNSVVRQISMHIGTSEVVGIVGESGSGKTTLSKLILGLLQPQGGTVRSQTRNILPVFQHASQSFNPETSLQTSFEEAIKYHAKGHREETWERLDELMSIMNLSHDLFSKRPDQVSGGQLQRLNIIRSMVFIPDLLICDEITAHLDVVAEQRIVRLIQSYFKQFHKSIILISHDLAFLQQLVDRFIVMKEGVIVDHFRREELFNEDRHEYTKELISVYDY